MAWCTGPTPVSDTAERSEERNMPSPQRSLQAGEANRSDHEEEPAQPEVQTQVPQATSAQPQEVCAEATKPTAWSKSFKEVVGHVRQPVMGPAKAPLTQKPPAPVVHLSSSAVQAAPVPKRALPSSSRRSAPRSALMADRVTAPPAPAVSSVQRPTAVRKAPIPLPVRKKTPASAAMKIRSRAITPNRPAVPHSAPNVSSIPSSTAVKPQPKAAVNRREQVPASAPPASAPSLLTPKHVKPQPKVAALTLPEAVATSASVPTLPATRSVKAAAAPVPVESSSMLPRKEPSAPTETGDSTGTAALVNVAATSVAVTSASSLSMTDAGRLSAHMLSETSNELPRIPDDFTAQGHYVSDSIKVKRAYNQVRSQHGVVVLTVKGKKGTLTCCVMTAVMLC